MLLKRFLQGNQKRDYVALSCGVKPGMLWGVDLLGRKLTSGWKSFAEENSFEDGDLLVFKYCGSIRFHVDIYRPKSGNTRDDEAMGDEAKFVTLTITADKLEKSRMFLPHVFCETNGLKKFAGKNIYMVAEYGTKFAVKLNLELFSSVQRLRLAKGLREFLEVNDINANDRITMELLWDATSTPTLKLLSKVILVPN